MVRIYILILLFSLSFFGAYPEYKVVDSENAFATIVEEKRVCGCKDTPELNEITDCKPTIFRNSSKLYREFDCESSRLVCEDRHGAKKILSSLEGEWVVLTHRLGYQFVREYDDTLLFQNRQASGGGFPINYELLSSENGEVIKNFGPIIYYEETSRDPYVLYFDSDSMDSVSIYMFDSKFQEKVSIPKGRIAWTTGNSNEAHGQYLFEKPVVDNHDLTIRYRYLEKGSTDKWKQDSIVIDLNEFRSQ